MASVVQIQIRVDEGDSAAVVQRVEQAVQGLGTVGSASVQQLNQNMDKLGGHTTTGLDQVRLLSQEFGFRLPRAMEAALSRMPAVTAGLAQVAGGLLAIGAAEVFVRIGKELYDLYRNFLSIDAPSEKFYETLKKTSALDFTNVRSIETLVSRLDQAAVSARAAKELASSSSASGWQSLAQGNVAAAAGNFSAGRGFAEMGANNDAYGIELSRKKLDIDHEDNRTLIENQHLRDANLTKQQQANAEKAKTLALDAEDKSYLHKVEAYYGNKTPSDAGARAQAEADARASAAFDVKMAELSGTYRLQLIKAEDEERLRGYTGVALAQQKELNAERELTQELINQHEPELIGVRLRQLRAQYAAEEAAKTHEIVEAAGRMTEETKAAGLTGAAKIQAERDSKLAGVKTAEDDSRGLDGKVDPTREAAFQKERVAITAAANQQIEALQQNFTDRIQQLEDGRTEASLYAFARIDAAAKKQADDLERDFKKSFDDAEMSEAQVIEQSEQLLKGQTAIFAAATQQKAELAQRNRDEDLHFDQEAAEAESRVREKGLMGWREQYRDAITNINAQEEARLAKLDDDAKKEGLTAQEVAQRKLDVMRQADAEIAEQNQQLQDKIAGSLQQAFTNPMEFIKSKLEQMFFEIIAAWIMRLDLFKNVFGQTMGGMQPGANGAGAAGGKGGLATSAMAHVLGIHQTSGQIAGGAPSGTGGVINGGTYLPSGYSGTAQTGGSSLGASSSGGSTASATGAVSSSSTLSQAPGMVRDALTTAQRYGVNIPGLPGSATSVTGSQGGFGGSNAPSFDDSGLGPEQQASADTYNASTTSAAGANTLNPGVTDVGLGAAAYVGGKSVYDSFFQSGAKGALDGAMGGAEAGAAIGTIVGGPVGTLIGAGIGAAAGLGVNLAGQVSGEAADVEARDYYRKTLLPQFRSLDKQVLSGAMPNYMDALNQVDSIAASGREHLEHTFGTTAQLWVSHNYLNKEIAMLDGHILQKARSGAQYTGMTANQFHSGGDVRGFGSLATSSTEGFIHAMLDEKVMNVSASSQHGPALDAMNRGASHSDIAGMYLGSAVGRGSGGSTTNHYHTHKYNAIDAKSFDRFLRTGGMKTIQNAANQRAAHYSGDSASG